MPDYFGDRKNHSKNLKLVHEIKLSILKCGSNRIKVTAVKTGFSKKGKKDGMLRRTPARSYRSRG